MDSYRSADITATSCEASDKGYKGLCLQNKFEGLEEAISFCITTCWPNQEKGDSTVSYPWLDYTDMWTPSRLPVPVLTIDTHAVVSWGCPSYTQSSIWRWLFDSSWDLTSSFCPVMVFSKSKSKSKSKSLLLSISPHVQTSKGIEIAFHTIPSVDKTSDNSKVQCTTRQ